MVERIFISYKRADKERVFPIVRRIEKVLKVKCWVDLDGIESSKQFASKICTAIDNAEVVLFMHSSAHLGIDFEKDWTIKELNYAQASNKKVVLVKLDDAPLKNIFLMNYGSTSNIDSNVHEQMEKLFNDLSGWLKLKEEGEGKEKVEDAAETLAVDGARAFHSGEYSKAVDLYSRAADLGSVEAMYALGLCYEFGKGVKINMDEAMQLYRKAVDKGCSHSKVRLEKNGKDIH